MEIIGVCLYTQGRCLSKDFWQKDNLQWPKDSLTSAFAKLGTIPGVRTGESGAEPTGPVWGTRVILLLLVLDITKSIHIIGIVLFSHLRNIRLK